MCIDIYSIKDSSGKCRGCPYFCNECSYNNGNATCTRCEDELCTDGNGECIVPLFESMYMMPNSNECKSKCEDGYVSDPFNYCFE
jgi:hypothetical protein